MQHGKACKSSAHTFQVEAAEVVLAVAGHALGDDIAAQAQLNGNLCSGQLCSQGGSQAAHMAHPVWPEPEHGSDFLLIGHLSSTCYVSSFQHGGKTGWAVTLQASGLCSPQQQSQSEVPHVQETQHNSRGCGETLLADPDPLSCSCR